MDNADQWTIRLATILSDAVAPANRRSALADLAASHATGDNATDQTRLRILDLIAQRDRQLNPHPTSPDPTGPTLLARLHAQGNAGIALVSVDLASAPLTTSAIRNWLAAPVGELVLIDAHCTPPLAQRLLGSSISDPRIRVVRLDAPVTWTQAFNLGFRIARAGRIWALSGDTRLATPLPNLAPLPAGHFAAPPQTDGALVLLDLHRADLAATGGFNEYLDTADGAVADLAQRLYAQDVHPIPPQPGLLTNGPKAKPAAPPPATASLRDALLQTPQYLAQLNRAIAALMPPWAGPIQQLPCEISALDDLGQHLHPMPPLAEPVPPTVRTAASQTALTDLLRDRFGDLPAGLGPHGLDLVLDRPQSDVSSLDLAVAASTLLGAVATRKAWLLIDMDADCLPHPGSPAAQGLATLLTMAQSHGQTPVLHLQNAGGLTSPQPCPVITGPLPPTGFWPTELRELARPLGDRAPRHATLAFTRQTLADLNHLALSGPTVLNRKPKLFIDAQHGLGNRMRAIASAAAIAAATDRELVIIWTPDDHCACSFDDLFLPSGAVLSHGFASEASAMGMTLFNYMEVEPFAAKDAPITAGAFQDIYARSAFPLVHVSSNWNTENQAIATLQPNAVVRALVASVRNPNDLSIHIRMEGGTGAEHLPYEAARNWSAEAHQLIDDSRKRSHFKYFLPRLDQLIAQGLAEKVFLAADTPAVYDEFRARYGARVAFLPRPAFDRSAPAIVYALADAILLGRAHRMLGSTWSSFSELAARLAPAPITLELTGRDF